MGAWRYLLVQFGDRISGRHAFRGISRPSSASPATGSASIHRKEQAELVQKAFA
jgi:2-oxoglutarate dehydrogenase complex dehydrogenase (E1) component-like enzyme